MSGGGHGDCDILFSLWSWVICVKAKKTVLAGHLHTVEALFGGSLQPVLNPSFSNAATIRQAAAHKEMGCTYQAVGETSPSGTRGQYRNEPETSDEATQFGPQSSHGTISCPFPDSSPLPTFYAAEPTIGYGNSMLTKMVIAAAV